MYNPKNKKTAIKIMSKSSETAKNIHPFVVSYFENIRNSKDAKKMYEILLDFNDYAMDFIRKGFGMVWYDKVVGAVTYLMNDFGNERAYYQDEDASTLSWLSEWTNSATDLLFIFEYESDLLNNENALNDMDVTQSEYLTNSIRVNEAFSETLEHLKKTIDFIEKIPDSIRQFLEKAGALEAGKRFAYRMISHGGTGGRPPVDFEGEWEE
jgi:hypothetical protein